MVSLPRTSLYSAGKSSGTSKSASSENRYLPVGVPSPGINLRTTPTRDERMVAVGAEAKAIL